MRDGCLGRKWRASILMPQVDRSAPTPAIEGTPIAWARREPPGVEAQHDDSASPDPSRPGARSFAAWEWLGLAVLVLAVFGAYQPAWQGGFIWDDNAHVTKPELRSWHGLYRIWFELGATQQYYPLLHSAFWVEHRLWGDATLGYHLVNILLHAAAAVLVALVLRRLAVPGAFLAAALFAPASGPRGIGGLDHGAKKHPLGRILSGCRAGLPPFRPDAEGGLVWRCAGACSCSVC